MNLDNIYLLLLVLIPMIVLAGIFFFVLNLFFREERSRRQFELKLKYSEGLLPNKLQAYERMGLFLERIRPSSLVRRVNINQDTDIKTYEYALMETIQTEFEHNLSQQVYINPETWKIIFSAKNATQGFIQECIRDLNENSTAQELQEQIIKKSAAEPAPSVTAIIYLQKDIQGEM